MKQLFSKYYLFIAMLTWGVSGCRKGGETAVQPATEQFIISSISVNGAPLTQGINQVNSSPVIEVSFSSAVNSASLATGIQLRSAAGGTVSLSATFKDGDSSIVLHPALSPITKYALSFNSGLKTVRNTPLLNSATYSFRTNIDSTDKFPAITDSELLDKVQSQTFRYFWDFGHPVSGLARERNSSGETVTSGGSGFGIMCILAGIHRSFITRAEGFARIQTIVGFLKNTAQRFHGAYPHWLNGTTGAVIPFSANDNGADLVETGYLVQGLICARQFFTGASPAETALRNDINQIWNSVEWDWFRQNGQDQLYWHWSPSANWAMNMQIRGWNECLITYVLAAASTSHGVPPSVYHTGWAQNGAMRNNNSYYGLPLPLGPPFGGPLFFAHYSFLGINPNGLSDQYGNYFQQNRNHTLINFTYCVTNPQRFFGYSNMCWGLTASDIENGYNANSPTNDLGVIAPTAAISSLPYTPVESMNALKFYYYKLGDRLWSDNGFFDAFSLHNAWFANSTLAIDQGPIIIMIENYRSGLLWDLFTSAPEIKNGMLALGFAAPYL